jgi:hypothetical protein
MSSALLSVLLTFSIGLPFGMSTVGLAGTVVKGARTYGRPGRELAGAGFGLLAALVAVVGTFVLNSASADGRPGLSHPVLSLGVLGAGYIGGAVVAGLLLVYGILRARSGLADDTVLQGRTGAEIVERRDWSLLALYLERNPDNVGDVVNHIMQQQQQLDVDTRIKALRFLLDHDIIEGAVLKEAAEHGVLGRDIIDALAERLSLQVVGENEQHGLAQVEVMDAGGNQIARLELDLATLTPSDVLDHLRAERLIMDRKDPSNLRWSPTLWLGDRELVADKTLEQQGVRAGSVMTSQFRAAAG